MISRESIKNGHPIKPLGELVEFLDSQRRPITEKDRSPGPYPYYGANGQLDSVADYIFDEPLVLLAEDGGFFDEPDRGIAYSIEGKTWVNNHAHVLRPRDCIRLDFLTRVLQNYDIKPWINGSTRAKLTKAAASRIEIPLPPLAEQKRIAGILDAADALRAKRREALAQLDTLVQSTFLDMFGDPVTNPMGWVKPTLAELGRITTGKTPPTKNEGMFGGEIPFATPGDLDEHLQSTARTITTEGATFTNVVRAGSALVGCIGNIGKMAMSPVATAFNQQINAIEWSELIDDSFGIHALRHSIPQMLSKASSTTVPILNKSGFSSVQMIAPPKELQRRFAAIVGSVEQQKARMRDHLTELDALFASLQSRAFNGEL